MNIPKCKETEMLLFFCTHRKPVGYHTHTPTRIDSPEPSSELPRPVEKLPAQEEEKEEEEVEEEVTEGGSVEGKAGCGMEDGLG